MSRNPIHHPLRRRPHPQHPRAPTRNLRAPSIVNDLGADTQTHGLGLQQQEVVFALDLQGYFCLAVALPAGEEGGAGGVGGEGFVAG